jgi:hypothetical protein
MKKIIKIIILFISIILVTIIVFFSIYYFSANDLTDIKVEGYVFDAKTKTPIDGVRVVINNERYESDNGTKNFDEYLGNDKVELITNSKGYYSTVLKKSAFVWVTLSKTEYLNLIEKGKSSEKVLMFKSNLSKK